MRGPRVSGQAGFTLPELMLTLAVAATVTGMAVPAVSHALDEFRTGMAARYLAARIRSARMDAVRRGTAVAIKLEPGSPDWTMTPYADGNGTGVRTAEIHSGVDPPIGAPEQLGDNFPGVLFGLREGVRDLDGGASGTEGVRIGSARILTLDPDGTATPGTLYVRGRRAQYAVRIVGATGRTRVLWYRTGDRTWKTR